MKHHLNTASEKLVDQTDLWGVKLSERERASLERYGHILENYRLANVIGTRSYRQIIEDHILDSLSCLLVPKIGMASNMVDVGAGAGLPGIPLTIMRPAMKTSLVEATGKKAKFMRMAAAELGLANVEILNIRVEELARDPLHRSAYDVATTRAVSSLAVLAEYCLPLLKVEGQMIAMKGRLSNEELEEGREAARILGARINEVMPVNFVEYVRVSQRHLVVIEKLQETSGRYPRKTAAIKKRPLGSGHREPK